MTVQVHTELHSQFKKKNQNYIIGQLKVYTVGGMSKMAIGIPTEWAKIWVGMTATLL